MAREELQANAWNGTDGASGPLSPASLAWGMGKGLPDAKQLMGPDPIDYANWKDPRVGWGVVLPDVDNVDQADKATGAHAPEPIRKLLKERAGSPVLYYVPGPKMVGRLRSYPPAGPAADLNLRATRGSGKNSIPYYLLIVGSPTEVPWSAQYRMQTDAYVGRLDLDPAGLERYVEALLGDWDGAPCQRSTPLVWTVDHGAKDITRLMRKTIAEPLAQRLANDPGKEFDMTKGLLMDGAATHAGLIDGLEQRKPAFVMSSSHGATYPLNDVALMRQQLGLPIDVDGKPLDLGALLAHWDPYGATWYSHACCSAGSDARSIFSGLVGASALADTLEGVAKVGACSAPLPRALLGGKRPARAFIGHVEPTFNWTLRDKVTGQVATQSILRALYDEFHLSSRPPLGISMKPYFGAVGGLLQDYADALDAVDALDDTARERARDSRLMAYDCLATVMLGDPTVRLPA